MIVDPDFVDHWKTRMLVAILGDDEAAPVYVLRLWAHCQNRRMWVFDIPAAALKGICRYPGCPQKFEDAMAQAGFILRNGDELTACGWDEYNASLIAAWSNGGKGGRPSKKPTENPRVNQSDNPEITHGKPMGEPIRGEGIGEEKNKKALSDRSDALGLLDYLNFKTGRAYQPVDANVKLILARLREGSSVEQCKAVIDVKVRAWLKDEKMNEYLRPETLFGAKKFAQYVGQIGAAKSEIRPPPPPGRYYINADDPSDLTTGDIRFRGAK